ncbi:MAG TPA: ABC transporter substrate-binding protein [Acidimicrobiales bacterium]
MKRFRALRLIAVLLVPILFASACSQRDDDDADGGDNSGEDSGDSGGGDSSLPIDDCEVDPTAEIEGDTIKLVSSFPQSGLTAAFSEIAKGWKSYFEMVNENGGVQIGDRTFTIEYEDRDDEYDAQKTAANIEELVGPSGEDAFAVFSVVGTSNNIFIRDQLGDQCVPNLFAATGAPNWGNKDYPWLAGGSIPPYSLESYVLAEVLKEQKPDAKVGMLIQDDDFGAGYRDSFEAAIEGTDIELVKVESYEPGASDVAAQVTSLAASGADVFFNGATLIACPTALTEAAQNGWQREVTWVSGTCISKTLMGLAGEAADGVYSIANIKDPVDPQYADDPAMQEYRENVTKFQPDADIDNGIVAYGWTQGALLVEALESAEAPTRAAVMEAVRNLDVGDDVGLLAEGTGVTVDDEDRFMGERFNLVQYNFENLYFDLVEAFDYEGQTAELTPEELINGG